MMMSHFLEYWKLQDFLLLKMKAIWYLQKFPPWNGEIHRATTGGGVQRNFSPIAKLQDTLFEKSNFCPKIQFWQNSNIFTSFSPKIFWPWEYLARSYKFENSCSVFVQKLHLFDTLIHLFDEVFITSKLYLDSKSPKKSQKDLKSPKKSQNVQNASKVSIGRKRPKNV